MKLSPDSQAVLLLCSQLGLSPESGPAALTLREWNPLARQIAESALQTPAELLNRSADELQGLLGLTQEEAHRIQALLERGGALAVELERLESVGIWVLTRVDGDYPARIRDRLGAAAPPVRFGAGPKELLGRPGLAVVGSRNVDEAGQSVAEFLGRAGAASGLVVYSGAARGVDRQAMIAALQAQGQAVGVLADSLQRTVRPPETREALARGDLTLLTPYSPKAGFSVGAAMGRNKLIYVLADYAIVVASEAGEGGTWAGAIEALKQQWVPVFVRDGPGAPEGNRLLLQEGAQPFPVPFPRQAEELGDWLKEHGRRERREGLFE